MADAPLALDDKTAPIELKTAGKLWHSQFGYQQAHAQTESMASSETGAQLDLSVPWNLNIFKASIEGILRGSADDGSDVLLREAYFDLSISEKLSMRLGQQIFSWGYGVLYNPVDRLSPWDATDPFQPRQLGIPAVKLAYATGVQTLEAVYIPGFVPTKLPGIGDRFFIYYPQTTPNPSYPMAGPPEFGVRYAEIDDSFEPSSGQNSQHALRYSLTLEGWEMALTYFSGYEHTAIAEGVPLSVDPVTGIADVKVNYIHPQEKMFGLDISKYFGKVGVHFDGAQFKMKETGHNIGVGDKDYASVLGGIDYRFIHFIGSQDLSVSVEYAREIKDEEDNKIYINRIYADSVLLRLSHFIDFKWSGEARYVYNFDNQSYWGRLSYTYQYSDHTQVAGGWDVFGGPENTFYGAFDRNDRVFATLTVQY